MRAERWWSSRLEQDITVARWGEYGRPVLLFPTAGGDAFEAERNGLIDACSDLLSSGRVKIYSVDSTAGVAMVQERGSVEHRMWLFNAYQECVRREVVPWVHGDSGGSAGALVATGASIGAYNSLAVLCRYPDVFGAAVCMSGTYDIGRFVDSAYSDDLYVSTAVHFVPGLSGPHLDLLRTRFAVVATGQGPYEDVPAAWHVGDVLGSQGVPNRVDVWGPEWAHDWPTWLRMLPQYLDELC